MQPWKLSRDRHNLPYGWGNITETSTQFYSVLCSPVVFLYCYIAGNGYPEMVMTAIGKKWHKNKGGESFLLY